MGKVIRSLRERIRTGGEVMRLDCGMAAGTPPALGAASIAALALDADWSVEITFADPVHEPDRAGGSKEISLD